MLESLQLLKPPIRIPSSIGLSCETIVASAPDPFITRIP